MIGTQIDRRLLFILYLLSFILLREWLLPVMMLTDTSYLQLFLLFIALVFLLALARVKWWLAVPLKIIYIIWAIQYMYLDEMMLSIGHVVYIVKDLLSNIPTLVVGNWEAITNPFRTLLFFSLLWMTTYLIRHWIEVRKSILLFYSMTVIFIATIDTFSPLATDGSIIIVMVTGLLLLGLLAVSRLAEQHKTAISTGAFLTITVPLLIVTVISSTFANFMPKQDPIWPDPVPYFKSIVLGKDGDGTGIGNGVKTSGYGTDDTLLGGSFVQDETLVFEARVADKQYWKIETKNTYTSKGWEQLSTDSGETVYTSGMEMTQNGQQGGDPRTADLQVELEFPFIVYPYGMQKVNADGNVAFLHSDATGKYTTEIGGRIGPLSSYEIEFEEPDYSLTALRATEMQDLSTLDASFSQYLQLPEELPDRVRELAVSITENQESVYEKAKAVESYFGKSGFVYAQQNVAVPDAGQDYVDQFLFDTKRGYCDNFSTSMVVMLRSIDIPARWVKGFAPGEYQLDDEGERVYQITNNEAHSWVEAYLPGIGWMPFEPTIGFSNLTDIDYDIELDGNDPQAPETNEQKPSEREKSEEPGEKVKKSEMATYFKPITSWFKEYKWVIITGMIVLALLAWLFYSKRVKWLPKVLIKMNRSEPEGWETFVKRYNHLLKQLDRFGLKRSDSMTLTDYAVKVDRHFGEDRMSLLTTAYEKGLYGGNTNEHDWAYLKELWEDLINRTSG